MGRMIDRLLGALNGSAVVDFVRDEKEEREVASTPDEESRSEVLDR